MKKIAIISLILASAFLGCKQEPIGQQALDGIAPGAVSKIVSTPIPGGAILTYQLPTDEDLLYVKAIFNRNGNVCEVRTSMYTDTLKVLGFGDTAEREVEVIAVDRSRNESPSVKVKINPLDPPVKTIGETLRLVPDFGGVTAFWQNPQKADIGIVVMGEDNNKDFTPIETFYSKITNGEGIVRGLDSIPANFKVFARDRWGNTSEMKEYSLKPLFEEKLDKKLFKAVTLPKDAKVAFGWVLTNIWDGNLGTGFHTGAGSGDWPAMFTIDLGKEVKLSRITAFQRPGTYAFAHGNWKKAEYYGAKTLDPLGGDLPNASWTYLGTHVSVKPSGLPIGQTNSDDLAVVASGESTRITPDAPSVRYIRVRALENWSGGDFMHMMELDFYGNTKIKN